jgi:uncharacterized protein (TIGR01777 family)
MPTQIWQTSLPHSADTVYDWHARRGAFRRLAPPWEQIRFIDGDHGLGVGARTVFEVKKGPAWLRWEAEHTACEPGRGFTDVQHKGPFASWIHEHRFEPTDTGSELIDRVTWKPPGGVFGGVAIPSLRAINGRNFTFRHRRTRQDLARHATYADRPRRRVAVTGATGLVGTALCAFLTTGGHEVVRVVRRDPAPGDCVWDPAKGRIDLDALRGVDAVVHLAGAPVSDPWTEEHKRAIRDSRVQGTTLIAEACVRLDPRPEVLISDSAIGIYGNRADERLTEISDLGDDFLAEVGRAWEAAAEPVIDAGVRLVTPRIGIVTTSAGAALARLLPVYRAGGGGPVGSGEQWVSWIALDDLIGLIYASIFEPTWSGPINATAPHPIRQREQARILGRVLGRPAIVPLPEFAVRSMFGEMGENLILGGQRVAADRAVNQGFQFDLPTYEEAVRATLGLA